MAELQQYPPGEPSAWQSIDSRCRIAAWMVTTVALFLVIKLKLLLATLAGLLVFELVQLLVQLLHLGNIRGYRAKVTAVAVLAACITTLLILAIFGTVAFLRSDAGNLSQLLAEMAAVIESSRDHLPSTLTDHLPADVEGLQSKAVEWLRSHATAIQVAGQEAVRGAAHVLIGLVIGAMVSLREAVSDRQYGPLTRALAERIDRFSNAFRRVVFAQVRISALNTFFTWLYLGVALPMFGVDLPFLKTLIAVTFVAGLLPVIGNLISNTVIVIVSLNWSIGAALASLGFLVTIHKLEYFLNAHIVGSRIRASAWELLIAMLVMEAAFGIRGLIAAPIYYAYLKDELSVKHLL